MEREGAIPVNEILEGDVIVRLKQLPAESVHCVVTSPPYWGLRDYGVQGQLGLEASPRDYLDRMVAVFSEVRRVLRSDGTIWVNMGDCYAGSGKGRNADGRHHISPSDKQASNRGSVHGVVANIHGKQKHGIKPKDLVGMPWRLAFALQEDGWYLRRDIIWAKPDPMPESVNDRPTTAHEYVFLLSKSRRYHYDKKAVMEPVTGTAHRRVGSNGDGTYPKLSKIKPPSGWDMRTGYSHQEKIGRYPESKQNERFQRKMVEVVDERNCRSVWTIPTQPYSEAHFATYPERLVIPCILAGCPIGGVVLDPFMGSGTTALVALKHSRKFIGIELNPEYAAMARERLQREVPLLTGRVC